MSDASSVTSESPVLLDDVEQVEEPPSLADQLKESRSIQKRQQRQLALLRRLVRSYENEPIKKLRFLKLDECVEKLTSQRGDYDMNADIILELVASEEEDNYDQVESDIFDDQQEFEQLSLVLTKLQSFRESLSRCLHSQAVLQSLKRQPDITGEACQAELRRAREALDCVRIAETNDDLQLQLEQLETLYGELLSKSDSQMKTQALNVDKVMDSKPDVLQVRSSSLKMKMPTFDGDILRWQDFWTMFMARLKQETHLTEADKGNLLVQSITEPAARRRAEQAIVNHDTFEAGSALVREEYENPKILFARHYEAAHKPDHFKENRDDLIRLQQRIDASLRGLQASKGLSAEQFLTHAWAQMMSAPLAKEWRTFTQEEALPPNIKTLQKFVAVRKNIATTDVIAIQSTKTDKPSKPKVNQVPRRNALRIQGAGRTIEVQRSNNWSKCVICGEDHYLFLCSQFKELSEARKQEVVRENKLCTNCLSPSHQLHECYSSKRCKRCKGKHHTFMHRESAAADNTSTPQTSPSASSVDVRIVSSKKTPNHYASIPFTALGMATSEKHRRKVRVQIDTGAGVSLVTARVANALQAKKFKGTKLTIKGYGGALTHSSHLVEFEMSSLHSEESMLVRASVVDDIPATESHAINIHFRDLPVFKDLTLADPEYSAQCRVDILLGGPQLGRCLLSGIVASSDQNCIALNSIFGWIVGGSPGNSEDDSQTASCRRLDPVLEDPDLLLRRFWEIEDSGDKREVTHDEQLAINHFISNTTRSEDGRYCVCLPRREDPPTLGYSRGTAVKRYLSNERSLQRQCKLEAFNTVVEEYITLGHAEKVPPEDLNKPPSQSYYLPMHGVVKESSTTTKLRVVFDASAKTSTGYSLNDILLPGPSLYPKLTKMINQFRLNEVGMTGDISKMFREVSLHQSEYDFHRFIHRDASGKLQDYRMRRLTFGVTSSPYLASRVLLQLADDHGTEFPRAAKIIRNCFYVDDCLTGAPTVQEAREIQQELIQVFKLACMNLRKWRTNSKKLLESTPVDLRESSKLELVTTSSEHPKALGVHWDTELDTMHVTTPEVNLQSTTATKRQVSSTVAKIFDIMGWHAPALIPAKIILQQLWKLKLDWDEKPPEDLQDRWSAWVKEINLLTTFSVPRHLGSPHGTVINRQLHGFGDASNSAYGGVVYLRTMYEDTTVVINLVMAKARVTPVKTQTIPRLELCGSHVTSQLLHQVAEDLHIPTEAVYGWTDSTIVLGWLKKCPSKLKVYVSHRVTKITTNVPAHQWRYVNTLENPADLLSRGVSPEDLVNQSLWWNGPSWLSSSPAVWPRRPDLNREDELPEVKINSLQIKFLPEDYSARFSSFNRLIRVTAWILRFLTKALKKNKTVQQPYLTLTELRRAKLMILAMCQKQTYSQELNLLRKNKELPLRHHLASLAPYLDSEGLMRVGGRLQKAGMAYQTTHPIILSAKSHITQLLVLSTHQMSLHAGPATLLSILTSSYHIEGLKRVMRKISRTCVVCQKAYGRTSRQMMGELPEARTKPARPFSIVGVDFAGPLWLKEGSVRKPLKRKCYLAVFICFSTRAVHLEIVMELTSKAFLATLDRFIARRGLPEQVFSDNGTNFIGAQTELQQIFKLARDRSNQTLTQWASLKGIQWHFSPGRAPHFGGLWEAAVRSTKILLRKTIGDHTLRWDELLTVLAGAEAVINSRPIAVIDTPPEDGVSPLTPGHFLIGTPLCALPTFQNKHDKITSLRRWNLVQRLTSHFWDRWKSDYLLQLKRRTKWKRPSDNLSVGDIVLITDSESFQRHWPMGRIVKEYPGTDGRVRVVDVQSKGNTYRRPIAKLIKLLGEEALDATSPKGEDVQANDQVLS